MKGEQDAHAPTQAAESDAYATINEATETPLDAWLRLVRCESESLDGANGTSIELGADDKAFIPVHDGFIETSQAWRDAQRCAMRTIVIAQPVAQTDMFAAPEPTIYAISDDELMRTRAFGGEEPADAANGECEHETGTAIAWDETRVVGTCNRGICIHTRSEWNEGHRICKGC